MARQVNDEGVAVGKQWEGLVLYSYDDQDRSRPRKRVVTGMRVKGRLTIGYGHTSDDYFRVEPDQEIDEAKADDLYRHDLQEAAAIVEGAVTVELNDNQFAALALFVLNVGPGDPARKKPGFLTSTLLKKLNAGDYDAVPVELAKWCHDDGKVVRGLVNRRAAEAGLWAKGAFVASNTEPVAPKKENPALSKEAIAGYATTASGAIATARGLDGPLAYALAAAIVIGALAAAYFFYQRLKAQAA